MIRYTVIFKATYSMFRITVEIHSPFSTPHLEGVAACSPHVTTAENKIF